MKFVYSRRYISTSLSFREINEKDNNCNDFFEYEIDRIFFINDFIQCEKARNNFLVYTCIKC